MQQRKHYNENKQYRKTVLALAVLAAFDVGAQENTEIDSAQTAIEEVVVIGEFQQSLVNRIPIAQEELPFTLNVVDRDLLDDRNFARPIEALTTLPNIFRTEDRQGTGGTQFLSRGFAAPILVDNRVQNQFRGSGSRDSSFVDRYEVLKGPVSIASGPVGGGGIINTVTKSPESDRFTDLTVRADQFGSAAAEFDTNLGDLGESDVVQIRVSGAYRDFEFDADEVGRKTTAIRPVATFKLGSATSAKASVAYTKHEVTPTSGFPVLQNGDIPDGIDTGTFFGYADSDGEVKDTLVNLEVNHDFLDNLKLTVRGSKQKTDFDYQNTSGLYNYSRADSGLETVYGFPQTAEIESEATFADAQLSYTADIWGQDQSFVIGIADDERSFERLFNTYSYDGPFNLADLDQPRFGGDGSGELSPFTFTDSKLNSVFAEAALRPTDKLTIVGGIRYDDLTQETVNFRRGNAFTSEYDDSELTIRFGASLEATENLNVYASYAQAFIPQFGVRRNDEPVAAETSDGFEVGVKGTAFDGALSFQTGLFSTVRQNVALTDPNNAPGEAFVISAGEVSVKGLEFSSNLNPSSGLNFTFNLGYADIEVTETGDDEISKPVFPELTASLYANYEIQSGGFEGLSIGAGFRHVGDREGPSVDWDRYSVVDLNFGYSFSETLELSFDILNVADERYVENTSTPVVNRLTGGAVLGAPRTASLTLKWKL
jgi:iron complex outermembrane receptor protein